MTALQVLQEKSKPRVDQTLRQMTGVGVRRVVLAETELDKLERPNYGLRCEEGERNLSVPFNPTPYTQI